MDTRELLLHIQVYASNRQVERDNLKAGIIKADWDDPEVQQSQRGCAEHYGFLISPCRPRTPQHKGKVEQGGVHYVKRNSLGGREPTTIPHEELVGSLLGGEPWN